MVLFCRSMGKTRRKTSMAQIRWHKRAAQELDEKLEYAREMFGSATVKRWMKELKDTEKRLSVMPESFTPEPILKDCRRTYRMCQLMNRRFKLIYTYYKSSDTVNIVDVWDSRMNPDALKKRLQQ